MRKAKARQALYNALMYVSRVNDVDTRPSAGRPSVTQRLRLGSGLAR